MKIGALTGGGDCPGLNAVLRAIVKKAEKGDDSVYGIKNGWAGLIEGVVEPLTEVSVSGTLPKGGTLLGTSRTNPYKDEESLQKVHANFKKFGLDALVAIGGEDTLGVARRLFEEGLPVVGVPKTIDNDLAGTDQTFGFDTAVNVVTEAIDRLHSTAESHHRIMVVEVMGRNSGWIATTASITGGADYVLIPEKPFDVEEVCTSLENRKKRGKDFSIVVVAEGAVEKNKAEVTQETGFDEFGHVRLGGIGAYVAAEIEKRTGIETRVTILGHIQRGGTPSAFDRLIATRYGLRAVDLVREKKFGRMVSLQGFQITDVDLPILSQNRRTLDMSLYDDASVFFS
ncbi:MAG: ATP-dependent 6-phosphofructokinase [Planctomycetota bacterium]|jgi:6-phosphofructokinase 1|nr:ATP-dependent 6-phosphofructokinase [Planctomycetota bacterium]